MSKMNIFVAVLIGLTGLTFTACNGESQTTKDKKVVEAQQSQYAKGQPVPLYNWSLERDLLIKLYNLRNDKVSTHSVWRSDYGLIEGDCTSMGFGMPYDTSLTNPSQTEYMYNGAGGVVGQAEPNGIFASTNTSATWVMCVGQVGTLEPHYVESKVTVYPYPVKVDYDVNRVYRAGKTTAILK